MPQSGHFYFFFDFGFCLDFGADLAGTLLYSRASVTMHVYASRADRAVIKPDNRPSEKIANNIIATTKTTVYPKFCVRTFNNFSKDFMGFSFVSTC